MLDVQNPEIRVDEIMRRIQEKVRLRREQPAAPRMPASAAPPLVSSLEFNQLLGRARDSAQVGASLPEMSRTRGIKRRIAAPVAKAFLRMAQLITRDQRVFNQAVLTALQALDERSGRESVQAAARMGELASRDAALSQRLEALEGKIGEVEAQAEQARRAHQLKLDQFRAGLSLQERRLTLLLDEARKRMPAPLDAEQLQSLARELPRIADVGYLTFEDAFRGSRSDIKERVSIYVPKLRGAGAGSDEAPIVDVGCGRGELLEVVREQGLKASGIDDNRAAVEKCRELGLEVVAADAFEALGRIKDGSLGGLTALHLVEHLPFPLVLRLLDEALRVLRPGGIAIFETPNPNNILVGASTFYVDPTHRNPVHPQTLHYLCEARGLTQVETQMLHPYPPEMRLPEDSPVARMFNEYFYGPQDYAVLGRRP